MRRIPIAAALAAALAIAASTLSAQERPPTPVATTRTVVSFEVHAAVVTRRSPSDWIDAVPGPLADRLAADHFFAGMELGSQAGNGISVRFHFPDMEHYTLWNGLPATQQMLAELRQVIGYGYARTSLHMRRVPAGEVPSRVAPPLRDVPSAPQPQPKAGVRMAAGGRPIVRFSRDRVLSSRNRHDSRK